ncbi:hypothetical protein Poli38472_014069 [Pythium oligandrum]|uniref:Uncharacterized protein n=1 Tax=Pythium oligandrum TaxID=41045 RepID=A0A8K1CNE1_PYTOL|nr:hypothetical protein Poli38472_014069 [Pythium oligandrum]|eukprot:TMW66757.1 hypothetical protein Poli38472_014069 [Pythium oligandrum]
MRALCGNVALVMALSGVHASESTLVVPALLDIHPVVVSLDLRHSIVDQLAGFCSEHHVDPRRCHVLRGALRDVVELERAPPCRWISQDQGMASFMVVKSLFQTSTQSETAFSWLQDDAFNIASDLCGFLESNAASDATGVESCAASLGAAIDQSSRWINTLSLCAGEKQRGPISVQVHEAPIEHSGLILMTNPSTLTLSERISAVERLIASLSVPVAEGNLDVAAEDSAIPIDPAKESELENMEQPNPFVADEISKPEPEAASVTLDSHELPMVNSEAASTPEVVESVDLGEVLSDVQADVAVDEPPITITPIGPVLPMLDDSTDSSMIPDEIIIESVEKAHDQAAYEVQDDTEVPTAAHEQEAVVDAAPTSDDHHAQKVGEDETLETTLADLVTTPAEDEASELKIANLQEEAEEPPLFKEVLEDEEMGNFDQPAVTEESAALPQDSELEDASTHPEQQRETFDSQDVVNRADATAEHEAIVSGIDAGLVTNAEVGVPELETDVEDEVIQVDSLFDTLEAVTILTSLLLVFYLVLDTVAIALEHFRTAGYVQRSLKFASSGSKTALRALRGRMNVNDWVKQISMVIRHEDRHLAALKKLFTLHRRIQARSAVHQWQHKIEECPSEQALEPASAMPIADKPKQSIPRRPASLNVAAMCLRAGPLAPYMLKSANHRSDSQKALMLEQLLRDPAALASICDDITTADLIRTHRRRVAARRIQRLWRQWKSTRSSPSADLKLSKFIVIAASASAKKLDPEPSGFARILNVVKQSRKLRIKTQPKRPELLRRASASTA